MISGSVHAQKKTIVSHTSTERQDTGPEIAQMERNIDPGKRDGSETTFQLDVSLSLLLFLHFSIARLHDLAELLDGE